MVKSLDNHAYLRARDFILTRARKLEAALFRYEFEQGDWDDVLRELMKFQNEDGGFGNALEPDLRSKESSALATTTALQILLETGRPNEEIIHRAMQYFLASYDEKQLGWDIIPQEAEQAPRAIWWEYGAFKDHWGNPSAEIVGYLNLFPPAGVSDLANRLNTYASQYLREISDRKEMHEMLCFVRWASTLPKDSYDEISGKLDEFIDNCVVADPEQRNGYGCVPLTLVNSPDSRFYAKYENVISGDLDALIEAQGDDGAWSPNWAWGRFEQEWETARGDWQGVLTLNALRTLRNFGRLGQ
jgi:hypothetical protein